jgi:hypothetical protein
MIVKIPSPINPKPTRTDHSIVWPKASFPLEQARVLMTDHNRAMQGPGIMFQPNLLFKVSRCGCNFGLLQSCLPIPTPVAWESNAIGREVVGCTQKTGLPSAIVVIGLIRGCAVDDDSHYQSHYRKNEKQQRKNRWWSGANTPPGLGGSIRHHSAKFEAHGCNWCVN